MTLEQLKEAILVLGANFKVKDLRFTRLVPKGWG